MSARYSPQSFVFVGAALQIWILQVLLLPYWLSIHVSCSLYVLYGFIGIVLTLTSCVRHVNMHHVLCVPAATA